MFHNSIDRFEILGGNSIFHRHLHPQSTSSIFAGFNNSSTATTFTGSISPPSSPSAWSWSSSWSSSSSSSSSPSLSSSPSNANPMTISAIDHKNHLESIQTNHLNLNHPQYSWFNSDLYQWCLWFKQQADVQNLFKHYYYLANNVSNNHDLTLTKNYNETALSNPMSKIKLSVDINNNNNSSQINNDDHKLMIQKHETINMNDLTNDKSKLLQNKMVPISLETKSNHLSPIKSENIVDLNNGRNISKDDNVDENTNYKCDWPECNRRFQSEQILIHHRRFHIRKSNYQCKHCSVRLLNSKDLVEHLIRCENKKEQHLMNNPTDKIKPTFKRTILTDSMDKQIKKKNSSFSLNLETKTEGDGISELNNRKLLINQLISPKNSKNSDLKKALLAIDIKINNRNNNGKSSISSLSPGAAGSSSTLSVSTNDRINEYKKTRYSGIGRYRCPWPDCNYTPHFLRDLRRHMFKHTGDKRYKCSQCRFVSVWKTSLLQHQRKKHNLKSS